MLQILVADSANFGGTLQRYNATLALLRRVSGRGVRSTNGHGVHMLPNGLQDLDLEGFGSGGRDRTYDQLINSQLLYR